MTINESETEMSVYDMGDTEPITVESVLDYRAANFAPRYDFCWDPQWVNTTNGWKGYENGNKVYLPWDELTRRYGPLTGPPA